MASRPLESLRLDPESPALDKSLIILLMMAGKNKTRIWRVGLEGSGDGETELEALPHPISFQCAGKTGWGTKVQRAVL